MSPQAFADDPVLRLETPETESAMALTRLANLRKDLTASARLSTDQAIGPRSAAANQAFEAGMKWAERGEWLSAIRELRLYLTLTQVPNTSRHLSALAQLARAFEETGQNHEAVEIYLQYLAAAVTGMNSQNVSDKSTEMDAKNQTQFLRSLQRLLPLMAKEPASTQERLIPLLSGVTGLNLPSDLKASVLFESAKAIASLGHTERAAEWLGDAARRSPTPRVEAAALYYRALMALKLGDLKTAETTLDKIFLIDGDITTEVRDLARLAQARLAVRQRKASTALKTYAQVKASSPFFRDALFESIYVDVSLDQMTEARNKAILWLSRYGDTPQAVHVRTLQIWLDLRSNLLNSARQQISTADTRMNELLEWLKSHYEGKERLTRDEVNELLTISRETIIPSPMIVEGSRLFGALAAEQRRLSDLGGEVRDARYTLGSIGIERLRPEWVRRTESLARQAQDTLEIGHRLIAVERRLYAERLSPAAKQRFEAAETRRLAMLSRMAEARRQMAAWPVWAAHFSVSDKLAKGQRELLRLEAELAAARLTATASPANGREPKLASLESQTQGLRERLTSSLEKQRAERVRDYALQSPHQSLKSLFTDYALSLTDESDDLANLRENAPEGAERFLADDYTTAWASWRTTVGEIFAALNTLDKEIKDDLNDILARTDKHHAEGATLLARLTATSARLESLMAQSFKVVLAHYENEIEKRRARQQKWLADIDWLEANQSANDHERLRKSYELERQILEDQLLDLEKGVR
jgi:hypothetical protein